MRHVLTLAFAALCLTVTTNHASTFKTEQWQTDNGAHVVFYQAKEVPMVDILLAFAAGSAYDEKQFGLSTLTLHMLNQGNDKLSATQVAETLAKTGAQYEGETSQDMAALHLRTLSEEKAFEEAVTTFSQIINKPNFPFDAFQREKKRQIASIIQSQESPDDVANQTFFSTLYGTHPYGHPVEGTKDTVKKIELNAIRHFYKRFYVGSNATLVIVGDLSLEKAKQTAEILTKNLPQGQPAPRIPVAEQLNASNEVKVPFPASQTVLRLGQLGINHHVSDYFPLTIGNYIFGGGTLVSRLSHEVREQRGLSYGVSSQFIPMPGDGPFIIALSTQTQQTQEALHVTNQTLQRFLSTGPTEEEMTAAKQYLTGSFPLALASNSSIANMLLRVHFYQLPDNYLDTYTAKLEAVTREEVKRAFEKQIDPQHFLTVMVGR